MHDPVAPRHGRLSLAAAGACACNLSAGAPPLDHGLNA